MYPIPPKPVIPTTMLRPQQAAEYVKLTTSTLAKMRLRGDGPTFSKAGPRIVVYDKRELDAWLQKRKFQNTSQYGTKREGEI